MVGPVGRLVDLADVDETNLSERAQRLGVQVGTLADYVHAIDMNVRELQLKASILAHKQAKAEPSSTGDLLTAFAQSVVPLGGPPGSAVVTARAAELMEAMRSRVD